MENIKTTEYLVEHHFFDPKTKTIFSAHISINDQQRMKYDAEYAKIMYNNALKAYKEELPNIMIRESKFSKPAALLIDEKIPNNNFLNAKNVKVEKQFCEDEEQNIDFEETKFTTNQVDPLNLNEEKETTNNDKEETPVRLKKSVWDYNQTRLLIKVFKSHINDRTFNRNIFWKNISNDMIKHRYNVTPKMCCVKWQTLNRSYKHCKDSKNETAKKRFKYFEEFDSIFKSQKTETTTNRVVLKTNDSTVPFTQTTKTNQLDNRAKKLELMEKMIDVEKRKLSVYEKQCDLLEKYFKIKAKEKQQAKPNKRNRQAK